MDAPLIEREQRAARKAIRQAAKESRAAIDIEKKRIFREWRAATRSLKAQRKQVGIDMKNLISVSDCAIVREYTAKRESSKHLAIDIGAYDAANQNQKGRAQ